MKTYKIYAGFNGKQEIATVITSDENAVRVLRDYFIREYSECPGDIWEEEQKSSAEICPFCAGSGKRQIAGVSSPPFDCGYCNGSGKITVFCTCAVPDPEANVGLDYMYCKTCGRQIRRKQK